MVPSDAGYVELTGVNPYDPEKAKALLKEAGVQTPLNVTLTLPPPAYAEEGRRDHRVAAVGGRGREDRERRVGAVALGHIQGQLRPHRDQPRRAARLRPLRRHRATTTATTRRPIATCSRPTTPAPTAKGRLKILGDIQRQLATDSVNVYLFQLPQFAVGNKHLKGLWSSSPIFANDQRPDLAMRPRRARWARCTISPPPSSSRCIASASFLARGGRRRPCWPASRRGSLRICTPPTRSMPTRRWRRHAIPKRAGQGRAPRRRSTACRR